MAATTPPTVEPMMTAVDDFLPEGGSMRHDLQHARSSIVLDMSVRGQKPPFGGMATPAGHGSDNGNAVYHHTRSRTKTVR